MSVTPLSLHEAQTHFLAPCFLSRVRAGFPSPADDYMDKRLDLNEFLIHHPAATFYCWTEGESMEGTGIFDGDLLIVDRAEKPKQGDVVLASLNGELTCKILDIRGQQLLAANEHFPPIPIQTDSGCELEGVVIHSVRFFRVRSG